MAENQALLDRIRIFNKYVTNKILIRFAGKSFGPFSILTHTGRKSGRLYSIPVIAEPVPDGFIIALTYGKKVDWYANIVAKGGCSLRWRDKDYTMTDPQLIDPEKGLQAFPERLRSVLQRRGIHDYLLLTIQR